MAFVFSFFSSEHFNGYPDQVAYNGALKTTVGRVSCKTHMRKYVCIPDITILRTQFENVLTKI